ncbi:MAG TPA: M23 family metallopeptidase [Steroidobacteraceae bacterium]|nr:M23 family metallopeptidase [Steroidobacteraceae bacterium]
MTRPSFVQAAADVVAATEPRRFGIIASCVVTGAILAAVGAQFQNPLLEPAIDLLPAAEATVAVAPRSAPFEFVAVTIGRNDTLDQIFRGLQLKLSDLAELRNLPDVRKSLDMIRPGDVIQLTHLDGEIRSLTRRIDETATLSVTRAEQGFSANIVENPLETSERLLRGTVDSSLYVAVNAAGGTDRLAVELADVFKYDIDFVNQVQPGDSFIVAHERQFQDGEFVRDGDILAAEFTNSGKTWRAVRYVGPNGRPDYYTPDGRPVRKAFLRYPVDYARISSGFSLARRHPVLNRVRAHKGIDFAAATGTPIKAAGAGKIVSRGRNGGYGNVVVLSHSGGITTLYGHMSRFAKGQKVGDRVHQGQVIGYVGMTGLASGPHVHYEYRVNGVHKNPAKVTVPKADPIPASLMADFKAQTAPLLARLEAEATPDVQVASAAPAAVRAGR